MATEPGEYLVGAYLKLIEDCDFVDYNVRMPGGGQKGQREIDVVGIRFTTQTAYLCEVATHLSGVNYGGNPETIKRLKEKYAHLQTYADVRLPKFHPVFMFWAPYVPKGFLTESLSELDGLDLVINGEYKSRVTKLTDMAKSEKQDTGNPVFRILQILGALRD